jgi:hypothetical protein
MAIAELKEAITLLRQIPSLWVPGIVGGILAAALWVSLILSGTFFFTRLLVISALILHLLTTGILVVTRDKEGDMKAILKGGIRYYFRALLPELVIVFGIILLYIVVSITISLIGISSDPGIVEALTLGFMIPTVILTFFFDTAAVFEDRKVFESIQRSIQLAMTHINEVIAFLFVCVLIIGGIFVILWFVWGVFLSIFLYDKLEPIFQNETQVQTFFQTTTPDQFIALIGPEGMWITAFMLFIGVLLLVPLLYSYKACFYRNLTRAMVITQQLTTGEYDSKGRWYKY